SARNEQKNTSAAAGRQAGVRVPARAPSRAGRGARGVAAPRPRRTWGGRARTRGLVVTLSVRADLGQRCCLPLIRVVRMVPPSGCSYLQQHYYRHRATTVIVTLGGVSRRPRGPRRTR